MTQPTTDQELNKVIRQGISAVQGQNYMLGLKYLSQAYATSPKSSPAEGLSFYALCVAVVEKKYKTAIDLCKKAIEVQFYNPHHYANLTRMLTLRTAKTGAGRSLMIQHPNLESSR